MMALAGLTMLRVLQTTVITSFKERFSLGALLAFLVTVADVPLLNVGAAFWGLVAGFGISWLLERSDFAGRDEIVIARGRIRERSAARGRSECSTEFVASRRRMGLTFNTCDVTGGWLPPEAGSGHVR